MLGNAIQHYWKLVEEILDNIVSKMKLPHRGVRFRTRQAIIAAVEQSVRRLVRQFAVDTTRRLPDVRGDCAPRVGSNGSMSASGSASPGFNPRRGSKFLFENFKPRG